MTRASGETLIGNYGQGARCVHFVPMCVCSPVVVPSKVSVRASGPSVACGGAGPPGWRGWQPAGRGGQAARDKLPPSATRQPNLHTRLHDYAESESELFTQQTH